MAESKSLKQAVETEVKEAVKEAKTGDVATVKETATHTVSVDLPTGARSHPPE